jgi:hypothetical protein
VNGHGGDDRIGERRAAAFPGPAFLNKSIPYRRALSYSLHGPSGFL